MRKEFSRKVRRQAIERAAGHCEKCGAPLKGRAEVDHIVASELGGGADLDNAQVLCKACHSPKTRSDVRTIRKSDRQRDKNTGAIRPKSKIPSRQKPEKAPSGKLPVPPPRPLYKEKQ